MARDVHVPRQPVGAYALHVSPKALQLAYLLKNPPHTPEQQNKILELLKSNPSITSQVVCNDDEWMALCALMKQCDK